MSFVMIFELIALPAAILGWCAYEFLMTDRAMKRDADKAARDDQRVER